MPLPFTSPEFAWLCERWLSVGVSSAFDGQWPQPLNSFLHLANRCAANREWQLWVAKLDGLDYRFGS